jgi:hypothetical protein
LKVEVKNGQRVVRGPVEAGNIRVNEDGSILVMNIYRANLLASEQYEALDGTLFTRVCVDVDDIRAVLNDRERMALLHQVVDRPMTEAEREEERLREESRRARMMERRTRRVN